MAACVVLGVSAAWLVERTDLPGRRWWRVILALPLAVPSYLAAFAWISWRPTVSGFWGAALVLTLVSYPYVYLPVAGALRHADPALEEVARSLGANRFAAAWSVGLGRVRPAITAGALLVALYALSDFGAVATMRYEAFTWVIYGAYRAGFNPTRAAILALTLVALAIVLVATEDMVRGRGSRARIGSGVARRAEPIRLGRLRPAAVIAVAALAAMAVGFPIWRMIGWIVSFASTDVDGSDLAVALGHSALYGVLGAIATVMIAIPVGIIAARFSGVAVSVVERATYVAHALPGIVIAISMVYIGVKVLRPFYQQVPLIVLGYVVLFLPVAVGSVRSSVEHAPPILDQVARSLGSGRMEVLRRVTLPLAAPGIGAASAMVLLAVMKELPVTLILRPTGAHTLATRVWDFTSVSDYANAGPYALVLVLCTAVPTALLVTRR